MTAIFSRNLDFRLERWIAPLRRPLPLVVVVVLLSTCAKSAEPAAGQEATRSGDSVVGAPTDGPDGILAALGSDRVTSLAISEDAVEATSVTNGAPGDSLRSMWYASVAGVALAEAVDGESVTRRVVDIETQSEIEVITDPVRSAALSRDLTPIEEEFLQTHVGDVATSHNLEVVGLHYLDMLGGAAEIVVRPREPNRTLPTAGTVTNALLGPLADNRHSYLVVYVDEEGEPRLVVGFVVGLGGDPGVGLGWSAKGVETDAIWGGLQEQAR